MHKIATTQPFADIFWRALCLSFAVILRPVLTGCGLLATMAHVGPCLATPKIIEGILANPIIGTNG
jgi:hypothetical protein